MGEIRKGDKTRNTVGRKDENEEMKGRRGKKRRRKEYEPHSVALKYSQSQSTSSLTGQAL
jgi:hypothetical protein